MFQCPAPIINFPPAAPNHEWLRILATAGLGFLVGAILEPVKSAIQRYMDRRMIFKAIHDELRRWLFITVLAERQVYAPQFWLKFDLPAYTHFYATKREMFYRVPQLASIGIECAEMLRLAEAVRNSGTDGIHAYGELTSMINLALGTEALAETYRKAGQSSLHRDVDDGHEP